MNGVVSRILITPFYDFGMWLKSFKTNLNSINHLRMHDSSGLKNDGTKNFQFSRVFALKTSLKIKRQKYLLKDWTKLICQSCILFWEPF